MHVNTCNLPSSEFSFCRGPLLAQRPENFRAHTVVASARPGYTMYGQTRRSCNPTRRLSPVKNCETRHSNFYEEYLLSRPAVLFLFPECVLRAHDVLPRSAILFLSVPPFFSISLYLYFAILLSRRFAQKRRERSDKAEDEHAKTQKCHEI